MRKAFTYGNTFTAAAKASGKNGHLPIQTLACLISCLSFQCVRLYFMGALRRVLKHDLSTRFFHSPFLHYTLFIMPVKNCW